MKEPKARIAEKVVFFFFDLLAYSCVFYFFIKKQYEIKFTYIPNFYELIDAHYKAYFIIIFFWIIISNTSKLYSINTYSSFIKIIYKILIQVFLFIPIIFTVSGLKSLPLFERSNILYFSFIILLFLVLSRLIYKAFNINRIESNFLFIGDNNELESLKNIFKNKKNGNLYELREIEISDFNNFISYIKKNQIDKIILTEKDIEETLFNKILNFCEDYQIEVNLLPVSFENNYYTYDLEYIDNYQLIKISRFPLDKEINHYIKLLLDKIISFSVCVFVMSWLFPLLAILIKLDSKGPVIFKQKRTGINGVSFDCYKFRTMKSDGTNSIKATVVNDNRITRLGNFLRKTSLDEFPQFFNVLKGDMSIIGPRPHMLTVDEYYSNVINRYYFRYYVRPGITGLSQVSGFRGDMTEENMNDRIRTDIFYIKNWSLSLDLKILFKTFSIVFVGDKNAI